MKLLLVFALCGVTCCLAGPRCSRDDINKCVEFIFAEDTEEEMHDKICRQTECWVAVYERCGTSVFGKSPFPVKGHKKSLEVCDKSSPLYRKYLDNAECIKKVTKQEGFNRLSVMCGVDEIFEDKDCRVIPKVFTCSVDYVVRECGEDAGEVFRVGGLPAFDPYDCLSTSKE